jgi:hypothetical protein
MELSASAGLTAAQCSKQAMYRQTCQYQLSEGSQHFYQSGHEERARSTEGDNKICCPEFYEQDAPLIEVFFFLSQTLGIWILLLTNLFE